ncbi:MAG: OmpA family protein [Wenzhouxiangella sp.]|nr:OmpA family protein [Wenzhouxiangella sp.]
MTFERITRTCQMVASGLIAVLILAGCATTPQPHSGLDAAREAVEAADADPEIRRNAALELRDARDKLAEAERRWRDGADSSEVTHWSWMATNRANVARETTELRRMERQVEDLRNDRERLQLQARAARAEREAERRAEERARAEADRERAEADRRRAEAEREQAEAARLAEQAERLRAQEAAREADMQREMAERRAMELEEETRRMRDEAERLQRQIAELEARPTDRGLVLTLGSDVLFDFDRYELRSGAARTVERIADFLNEYEDRQVLVEGFTDSTGSREYNMGLSERRANSVRLALIERGVDEDRIRIRGYGPDFPVASNDNEAGRQLNRRVEVIISDDAEAVPEREE